MLRSMYAGISGMRGFQTKLDVIGNNIANVGTSGFKKGRVTFQDMMSQTTSGAQASAGGRGGINPVQVGLGSQVGSIDNIHTQGFRQSTGNPLDFAIEGDGMFVVTQGDATFYTRAGNFYLDDNGAITNPDGLYLQGYSMISYPAIVEGDFVINLNEDGQPDEDNIFYMGEKVEADAMSTENGELTITAENEEITLIFTAADEDAGTPNQYVINDEEIEPSLLYERTNNLGNIIIPENAESFSVSDNGLVNYVDENGALHYAGQIVLANFSNPAGLEKAGSNLFLNSTNAGLSVEGYQIPDENGMGKIISSALEMSNVDLGEEFTEMITAQRGFQANTRIITTSDEILQELVNLKR